MTAGPSDKTVIVQFLENGVRHTIPEAPKSRACDTGCDYSMVPGLVKQWKFILYNILVC